MHRVCWIYEMKYFSITDTLPVFNFQGWNNRSTLWMRNGMLFFSTDNLCNVSNFFSNLKNVSSSIPCRWNAFQESYKTARYSVKIRKYFVFEQACRFFSDSSSISFIPIPNLNIKAYCAIIFAIITVAVSVK